MAFGVVLFLSLACAPSASTPDLEGRVVAVRDGDTIEVLAEGDMVFRVRLEGIDCPEYEQDFSDEAKRFTSRLLLRKNVRVLEKEKDDYGRIVGRVMIGSEDASVELVQAGLAWHYKHYSDDPLLAKLEEEARAARIGLWSATDPVPPWEYREQSRERDLEPGQVYHGNVKSRVFHHPDCPQYDCKNCTRELKTRAEAISSGYRPCRICKP
jgi:endonuclease YncB( thermonuclease family)